MTGVKAARELKQLLHTDNLAARALRYILMYPEVSTVISGASSPAQIMENVKLLLCLLFHMKKWRWYAKYTISISVLWYIIAGNQLYF